jgi:hypothetical protein
MGELGWSESDVTQEHLQNLVSQVYMTVPGFATGRVPKDPTSPAPVGGYVMVCMWCAITPISLLPAIVLRLGVASCDSLGDIAYGDLRDPM